MTSIVMNSTSGPDGKLHLEITVGQPDTEFEVEVTARLRTTARSLPPGYFDLLGSVDDATLTVHSQPRLPPPLEVG